MLDTFEILSTSGVVLWSRTYVPVGANVINSLIRDVFIEERISPGANAVDDTSASHKPTYRKEGYTLKWTTAKDLGLIFVVRRNWNLYLCCIEIYTGMPAKFLSGCLPITGPFDMDR